MPVGSRSTRSTSSRRTSTRRTSATVSEAAAKATAQAPKVEAASEAAAEAKASYIFFNCNEWKGKESMDIFYNHAVYADTKKSRKLLLAKIKTEMEEKRVYVEEDNLPKVEALIMEGKPEDASQFLGNGIIVRVDSF